MALRGLKKSIITILCVILYCMVGAYASNPVDIKISTESSKDKTAGVLEVKIENGWYIYSPFSVPQECIKLKAEFKDSGKIEIVEWPVANADLSSDGCAVYKGSIEIPFMAKSNLEDLVFEYYACNGISCMHNYFTHNLKSDDVVQVDHSLWLMLIIALFGGFIMNFMPCVLPVLGIKIYGLMNIAKTNTSQMRRQIISMIAGTYSVFLILAVSVILLKMTGEKLFWGMHFQSPLFLSLMLVIFSIITLNIFGIGSLALNIGCLNKMIDMHVMEHFLYGASATILATPCLAPFLATALAFAIDSSAIVVLMIYGAMAFGMSVPFWILCCYPDAIRILPKPGRWMEVMKLSIGILMVIITGWLATIVLSMSGIVNLLLCTALISLIVIKIPRYLFWCILLLIIGSSIVHQNHSYNESIPIGWQKWSQSEVDRVVSDNEIALVVVGARWCMTCRFNLDVPLSDQTVLQFLDEHKVHKMYADYTVYNEKINDLLKRYGQIGVPTTIVFGPGNKEGITLNTILSDHQIKQGILLSE